MQQRAKPSWCLGIFVAVFVNIIIAIRCFLKVVYFVEAHLGWRNNQDATYLSPRLGLNDIKTTSNLRYISIEYMNAYIYPFNDNEV